MYNEQPNIKKLHSEYLERIARQFVAKVLDDYSFRDPSLLSRERKMSAMVKKDLNSYSDLREGVLDGSRGSTRYYSS